MLFKTNIDCSDYQTENIPTGVDSLLFAGIVMADIACTDLDSGEYGVVVLDLETATNQFKLSGTQLMTGGDPIDYEAIGDRNFVYNVQIVAVDNPAGEQRLTSTSIVTVKVLWPGIS